MSEVDTRPPANRGRSSHRGGRGGFGRGGPRGGSRKPTNGTTTEAAQLEESFDDQGELGEMKKKYASELVMLKDMFPDYTNDDLVFALQETDGDVAGVVDRVTQGNVSQFSEVKSAKDRARSKVKEPATAAGASADKGSIRGGRGRGGFESTRGGRGRGTERGRGGFRGGRGGHATTNGSATASVPTTEASGWAETTNAATTESSWDTAPADTTKEVASSTWDTAPATVAPAEAAKSSVIPEGGAKKTWAAMLAPKPAPVPVKKSPASDPMPVEAEPLVAEMEEKHIEPESLPPAIAIEEQAPTTPSTLETAPPELAPDPTEGEDLSIVPSKDPLTEENVEHLPDDSNAPATQTVASTTGSMDPRNLTPLPGQQAPIGRPPVGGYATTAYRATGQPGRSASFQRRVQEQQEAVVMPGHNAVNQAAVQFGSMGLNGEPGLDVDEDREEPETRQAPQHSPPAQPRTSLPPAPRGLAAHDQGMPEALPTPKQAPGLPPASQQNQQQMQEATLAPGIPNEPSQMSQNYNQYARYGQQGMQAEAIGQPQQKQYDPFSHQAQPSAYDHFGSQSQQVPQQQSQQQSHSGFGGLSSAPDSYSNYYTADQQRSAYNQYYGGGGYGPQDARSQGGQSQGQGQQDVGLGQQRSASGFGAVPNESAYPSQAQQQVSIPPSLTQLSAQLNNTGINDYERENLIKQIQHVIAISSANVGEMGRATMQQPTENLNVHGGGSLDPMREDRLERSTPASMSLIDVTNRKPPTPSTFKQKVNAPKPLAKQQQQSRFADSTNSGHNTPHPIMASGQQPSASAQQSQHSMGQAPGSQQPQQGSYGSSAHYPYGHPSYNSPYAMAYQQQFSGYGQYSGYGSYGSGGNKQQQPQAGMYGGSHGYGMAPQQSSYDQHSASPANAGAFGQNQQSSMRNVSGMSGGFGGLDDYTRGSTQAQAAQQQSSSAFGGPSHDPFARSASGFGGQNTGYGQQSMSGQDDALKPFADTSKNGPSPALGQPGRPTSAANSAGGSAQSGHPQQQQSGFGGYGGFPAQSQYGGLGGLGGSQQQQQQQHGGQSGMGGQQQGGYGSYGTGSGGFGQYGSYNSRGGGWGAQYGAH